MYHGKITKAHKKRKYAIGRGAAETTIGGDKRKIIRVKGDGSKVRLTAAKYANAIIDKKPVRCEILTVAENPANKDFIRRNIITKGAILKAKTPEGSEINLKVTSRPGQDGIINAVLA